MTTTPTTPAPTGGANGMMAGITTAHLIVLAVLAVVVVLAILYGSRLRAQRRGAERHERDRLAEFEAAPPPPSPAPITSTTGIGAPPIAPSPPPARFAGSDVPVPAALAAGNGEPADDEEAARAADPAPPVDPGAPSGSGTLTQLKGLGPKVAARLGELGITRLDQLAALDEDAAEAIDAQLGTFRGRLTRDRWVEQARFLAAGDRDGFEAVFGRL